MKTILHRVLIAGTGVLATMGAVGLVQAEEAKSSLPEAAPVLTSPSTFWNLLGIPQGSQKVRDARLNRLGNNPQRERVPPLKRIADPANLESKNPAIAAAAKIKKDQDLAPQKIKAIKYLGSIACCCPTNKDDVKNALLAALSDCTDEVRQAAATAICHAAGNPCAICNECSCCRADVMNKLNEMANEQDEKGCWKEPNPTVRAAAGMALEACRQVRQPEPAPVEAPPVKEEPKERRVPAPSADPGYSAPQAPAPSAKPVPEKPAAKPAAKPARKSADAEGWKVRAASAQEPSVGVAVITDQSSRTTARPRVAAKPQVTVKLQPVSEPQPVAETQTETKTAAVPAVKLEIPAKPSPTVVEPAVAEPKLLAPASDAQPKVLIKLSGEE